MQDPRHDSSGQGQQRMRQQDVDMSMMNRGPRSMQAPLQQMQQMQHLNPMQQIQQMHQMQLQQAQMQPMQGMQGLSGHDSGMILVVLLI
jgi:hypothetical protein